MTFSVSAYHNEYLPSGATTVHAVVTVTSSGGAPAGQDAERAVVLIVDTSGSMSQPGTKIRAARRATQAAVESLPDGTLFAVVAGTNRAGLVYPPLRGGRPQLTVADDRTRAEAVVQVRRLDAGGGTAISTWLALARGLFEPHPGAIRLAYLLTDGHNQGEDRTDLEAELARCLGVFQCDARGVGTEWNVEELRLISSSLLGEVDIIAQPDLMDDDFLAFLERAVGKTVADVRLRIWSPKGSRTAFVRQVSPAVDDLTPLGQAVNELTVDFPTGSWAGDESRDYHLAVDVPPGQVGDERLAARVSVLVGDDAAAQALVRALWTDDEALSTRINTHVAHYTGQAELAQAIAEGLEARKAGDDATATIKLGRAVQLATESGNDGTVRLLQKVVDVDDPATGTVRLRRNVEALDEMTLDTRSTRTVRVKAAGGTVGDGGPFGAGTAGTGTGTGDGGGGRAGAGS